MWGSHDRLFWNTHYAFIIKVGTCDREDQALDSMHGTIESFNLLLSRGPCLFVSVQPRSACCGLAQETCMPKHPSAEQISCRTLAY